jgi:hypothetical protein
VREREREPKVEIIYQNILHTPAKRVEGFSYAFIKAAQPALSLKS